MQGRKNGSRECNQGGHKGEDIIIIPNNEFDESFAVSGGLVAAAVNPHRLRQNAAAASSPKTHQQKQLL